MSVPARTADDPRPVLGRKLEQTRGRLWPVHRLDFEVSGLIIYAKSAVAHRLLNAGFANRQVNKTYEALTPLPPALIADTIYHWSCQLARGKKRAYEAPFGDLAETAATFQPHRTGPTTLALWTLHPRTGRPHQLRYQLFALGLPIVGDQLYGSSLPWNQGIALRSVALSFTAELCSALVLPAELRVKPLIAL